MDAIPANPDRPHTPPVNSAATNPIQSLNKPQVEVGSEFPVERLAKLDEQLSRPKWVVPVRPGDELEILLRSSIKLCKEGVWKGKEGGEGGREE